MIQSRTHNCGQLRISEVGEKVTLVGFYDNMRKVSRNLGFLILRDFYGVTPDRHRDRGNDGEVKWSQ